MQSLFDHTTALCMPTDCVRRGIYWFDGIPPLGEIREYLCELGFVLDLAKVLLSLLLIKAIWTLSLAEDTNTALNLLRWKWLL